MSLMMLEVEASSVEFLGLETGQYAALSREVIRRAESCLAINSLGVSLAQEMIFSEMSKSNLLVNCS